MSHLHDEWIEVPWRGAQVGHKRLDLKSCVPETWPVGSNPTPSAKNSGGGIPPSTSRAWRSPVNLA